MIKKLTQFIAENNLNVYDIAVMTEKGIENAFCQPCNPCNDSYSVTKLFIVTMIGILIERGELSLEDSLTDLLEQEIDFAYDERWKKVSVRHALTHKMGIDYGILDVDRDDTTALETDNYLKIMLDYPPVLEPGTEWVYSDVAHYLLSRVITVITGVSAEEAINREILRPLKFQPTAWQKCPYGYCLGATGAFMRSSDMVKLGWLYQNYGEYQGKQIISREWVERAEVECYDLYEEGQTGFIGKGGMCGQMLLYHRKAGFSVAWHSFEAEGCNITGRLIAYLDELIQSGEIS